MGWAELEQGLWIELEVSWAALVSALVSGGDGLGWAELEQGLWIELEMSWAALVSALASGGDGLGWAGWAKLGLELDWAAWRSAKAVLGWAKLGLELDGLRGGLLTLGLAGLAGQSWVCWS